MSVASLKKAIRDTLLTYKGKPKNIFYFNMTIDLISNIIGHKTHEETEQALSQNVARFIKDEAMHDTFIEDLMHIKELFDSRQLQEAQYVQLDQDQQDGGGDKVLNPLTGRYVQRGGRVARSLGLQ